MRRRRTSARTVAAVLAGAIGAAALAAPWWVSAPGRDPTRSPLHAEAIGVIAEQREVLDATRLAELRPGTRALDDATATTQLRWLAGGTVPGAGTPWQPMVRTALLDLHVLTLGTDPGEAAAIAAWSTRWRFVWPRDAAFVAAAYAVTGHPDDAARVLAFLQRVQPTSGRFQARYLPDGSGGVPDERGEEADGAGWTLWALARVTATDPALTGRFHPLLVRSTRACLDSLAAGRDGLPAPGLDYWEVPTGRVTLGVAAPALAGLEAAVPLLRDRGETELADRAERAATDLDRAITSVFAPSGYPREAGGVHRDAAVTFLLPPFRTPSAATYPAIRRAWLSAQQELLRPAGGLAPGARWRADGISWTPETALFALTAAASSEPSDHAVARHWLDWLDTHRTKGGALPEKVLRDGSPGSAAPLAWTAALTVLTVALLGAPPAA